MKTYMFKMEENKMYNRLGEIKRQHEILKKENYFGVTIHPRDTDWLLDQVEMLQKIVEILQKNKER